MKESTLTEHKQPKLIQGVLEVFERHYLFSLTADKRSLLGGSNATNPT